MFCPQFNKHHRKLLEKLYSPSCELQRKAEEDVNNHERLTDWLARSAVHRYKKEIDDYKDKQVCKEYEFWLDNGRG